MALLLWWPLTGLTRRQRRKIGRLRDAEARREFLNITLVGQRWFSV